MIKNLSGIHGDLTQVIHCICLAASHAKCPAIFLIALTLLRTLMTVGPLLHSHIVINSQVGSVSEWVCSEGEYTLYLEEEEEEEE